MRLPAIVRNWYYDPWPDIHEAHMRHYRALLDSDLSPNGHRLASNGLQRTYESYTTYVTLGRDRRKLGPEYARQADRDMGEALSTAAMIFPAEAKP